MNILEETQFSSTFSLQNKKLQKDRSTLKRKEQKYPTRTIDRFYQDELVETLNKRFNQCLEKIANI